MESRVIGATQVLQQRLLILHALADGHVDLFVALLKGFGGWPQSAMRPDDTEPSYGCVSCKASDIGKWLQDLIPTIPEEDREECRKRIIDDGGGRYFEDPPIEYTASHHGGWVISPDTSIGLLYVRKSTDGGRDFLTGQGRELCSPQLPMMPRTLRAVLV